MSKKDKVIKLTNDGRLHAMGLVVDTIDEAIERCERKGNTNNIFLTDMVEWNGIPAEFGFCGSPEYIRDVAEKLEL